MKKSFAKIILCLAAAFAAFSWGFEHAAWSQQTHQVEVDGVGAVTPEGGDVMARDAAISDALRNAVEQAVGTMIDSSTLVENSTLIEDRIYAKSKGYISSYTIIDENIEGDMYRVRISALVSVGRLKDDLNAFHILHDRQHKPRIMVIIPEYHAGKSISDPSAETQIIKKFAEHGFEVVDQDQIKKIRYNDKMKAIIDGDVGLAQKLAMEYDAEIFIIGQAFSESLGFDRHGFISCRARIEARVLKTDTGKILAADGKDAPGLDVVEKIASRKALTNAADQLADYFIEQILDKWSDESTGTAGVELVITGLDYSGFCAFKVGMQQSVRGIKALHQRSFSSGRGVLQVDVKGSGQSFTDDLAVTGVKGFEISITDVTPGRIQLKAKRIQEKHGK